MTETTAGHLKDGWTTRIYRNSGAHFNRGDLENLEADYTEAWFDNLRNHGFNGFWVQARLRDLVAFRGEESAGQRRSLERLKWLIARGRKRGCGLYLLLEEPRYFEADDPFWKEHPDLRGASGGWGVPDRRPIYYICTSTEAGRAYLYENALRLHRFVPELAGSILITASEYPTHCYSHVITNPGGHIFASDQEHEGIDCPRCGRRPPEEVVAEIINTYREAVRQSGSAAAVIAWNWSWVMYSPNPQPELIDRLDPEVQVLADFEIGGRTNIYGKERRVEEYSLIFVGPGDRYASVTGYARKQGHRHLAKLQVGTTHELATAANLPLLGNLFRKLDYLRRDGSGGFLASWNFGNRFTINSAAVGLAVARPDLDTEADFLAELCRSYLGRQETDRFVHAVGIMEAAFREFPIANRLLHIGPLNYALAAPLDGSPLQGKPLSASWLALERGDNWEECLGPYTLDEVITGLGRLAVKLEEGLRELEKVLFAGVDPWWSGLTDYRGEAVIPRHDDRISDQERVTRLIRLLPGECRRRLPGLENIHGYRCLQEWTNGWAVLCFLESAGRLFDNYRARKAAGPGYPEYLDRLRQEELRTVRRALPLFRLDERLGLHLECQEYLVSRSLLEAKEKSLSAEVRA
ncbi:MAG TPA: hypothetical protein PKM61_08125 [bacterium]|nr:hypothetical protein [bacterium]